MRSLDSLALGAVGGDGVGKLDMFGGRMRQGRCNQPVTRPLTTPVTTPVTTPLTGRVLGVAAEVEGAVGIDGGDGQGVAVGDAEVAVVAAGGDQVADAALFAGVGGEPGGGVGLAAGEAVVAAAPRSSDR